MQNKPKNAREWLIRITDQINIFNNWKEQENLVEHLLINDVVPVVRCKDCKFFNVGVDFLKRPILYCQRTKFSLKTRENDYCSFGERKCDNANTSTENSFLYNRFMKTE